MVGRSGRQCNIDDTNKSALMLTGPMQARYDLSLFDDERRATTCAGFDVSVMRRCWW